MATQNANTKATPNNGRRPPPPALNPESMALVQPLKDFVQKGWIARWCAQGDPYGMKFVCVVGDSVPGRPEGEVSYGMAKDAIIRAGLWSPKTRGQKVSGKEKEQARPAKSLVKKDFEDGPAKLLERTRAVAQALTDTTARGRIGSLKLYIEGADTFAKWWNAAPASSKVRLFADQKRYVEFTQGDFDLFSQSVLECPFRGTVPTPSEEEEDQPEAPQAPPATAAPRSSNNSSKRG